MVQVRRKFSKTFGCIARGGIKELIINAFYYHFYGFVICNAGKWFSTSSDAVMHLFWG